MVVRKEFLNRKVFCPLLWNGLSVGTLGEVGPCCFWPELGNINRESLEVIFNKPEIQKARQEMLDGKQPVNCKLCYEQENRKQGSSRLNYLRETELRGLEEIYSIKKTGNCFQIFDLRMSNTCNLQCRSCYSGASSVWERKVGLAEGHSINSKDIKQFLMQTLLDNRDFLIEVYFAGGEPVLIEEDWCLLEALIKYNKHHHKPINIRYNTNCTTFTRKGKNILDLWDDWLKTGGKLHVALSIDGIGPCVEYVRVGTKWDILSENIQNLCKRFVNREGFSTAIVPVLSIYTVLDIPNLANWAHKINGLGEFAVSYHNILRNPGILNLKNLTARAKNIVKIELQKRLEDMPEIREYLKQYIRIVSECMTIEESVQEKFSEEEYRIAYTEQFNKAVPALANWWQL